MWIDYFRQIQNKYSMRLSYTEPLVIRLDGKDVTKNKNINFMYKFKGSFLNALEKTAKYFTEKYHAYSVFGTDEISFIFPEPMLLIADLDNEKNNHSNEVIALFSQYFFQYFNFNYVGDTIFWHGKCYSIPSGKQKSYIKYRSNSIKNVMITYFLKRNNINLGSEKIEKKVEFAKKIQDYKLLEKNELGTLYYDGYQIDIKDYLENDKITKLNENLDEKINYNDLSSF